MSILKNEEKGLKFLRDSQSDIAIVTVSYHSQKVLENLADYLNLQSVLPDLWIIVDNSPISSPLNRFNTKLNLSILEGGEGQGFAEGCNKGLDFLQNNFWKGWVWLLNPDTILSDKKTLENLTKELQNIPSAALVGTAVSDINGRLEASAGWIDAGFNFRSRYVDEGCLNERYVNVDWVSGCSMLFKPTAHTVQNRFDISFPLYYEDMDFCLRLNKQGIQSIWLPSIRIFHQRGKGSSTSSARRARLSSLSYIRFLQRYSPFWVIVLRNLRLLTKTLILLPLNPSRGFATFIGWLNACLSPIK